MSNRNPSVRSPARQDLLPGIDPRPDPPAVGGGGRDFWVDHVRAALATRSSQALDIAEEGLRAWPGDPEMLLLAALTALAGDFPERALSLLKRYGKRYVPSKAVVLLTSLAHAQRGHFTRAWTMLRTEHLDTDRSALAWFVGDDVMQGWLYARLREIRVERLRTQDGTRGQLGVGPPPVSSRPVKPASAIGASMTRRSGKGFVDFQ